MEIASRYDKLDFESLIRNEDEHDREEGAFMRGHLGEV